MKTISGIELLQNIKNGYVKEGTKINVLKDNDVFEDLYDVVAVLIFKNNELLWENNTFRASMLYDDNYYFEILEEKKIPEKLEWNKNDFTYSEGTLKSEETADMLMEILDRINFILDYLKSKGE